MIVPARASTRNPVLVIAYLSQLAAVVAFAMCWTRFYEVLFWDTPWDAWFDLLGQGLPLSIVCLATVGVCGLLPFRSAPWVILVAALIDAVLIGVIAHGGNGNRSNYTGPSLDTSVVLACLAGAAATASILLRGWARRGQPVPVQPKRPTGFVESGRTRLISATIVGVSVSLAALFVIVAASDTGRDRRGILEKLARLYMYDELGTSILLAVLAGIAAMATTLVRWRVPGRVQPPPEQLPAADSAQEDSAPPFGATSILAIVLALTAVVLTAVLSAALIAFVADAANSSRVGSDLPDLSVLVIVIYSLLAADISAVGLLYLFGALMVSEHEKISWPLLIIASILGLATNFCHFRDPRAYGITFFPPDPDFPALSRGPMFAAIAPAVLCLATFLLATVALARRWTTARAATPRRDW
ncbi:hypothetical protein DFR70_10939 [Nocardia tenerifensis]|uniref:Uncharacterized protein n=1 Tax=Nocardia tenerifensis TaxID=228006 RepID=A0A318JYW6_9NOCA|nr:hypothetical protein [Nocardia tenerifensis]PXX60848.1 hypothetical protein DFR70_10939 [Nocardia tenerifensis]